MTGEGGGKISKTVPLLDRRWGTRKKKTGSNGVLKKRGETMAKDGTHCGGRRIRAGDKPDVLADKSAGGRAANIMELPVTELDGADQSDEHCFSKRTWRLFLKR